MIKKYLSLNIFGLYLFKVLTRIRLYYQKVTKNNSTIFFHYDQTKLLIEKNLNSSSNCIDVGASKGDILDLIIKSSPKGQHIAIEPIPIFYNFLQHYYKSKNVQVINAIALDFEGTAPFYFQTNEPAISGFSKVNKNINSVRNLHLPVIKLDSIVANDLSYDLIKIDCIGSELSIIKGAVLVLMRNKPLIIFDFIGAHFNNEKADELYELLSVIGYSIFLLSNYPNALKLSTIDFKTSVFDKGQSHFYASHKLLKE